MELYLDNFINVYAKTQYFSTLRYEVPSEHYGLCSNSCTTGNTINCIKTSEKCSQQTFITVRRVLASNLLCAFHC